MTVPGTHQRSVNEIALSRHLYRRVLPPILVLTALNAASQIADPRPGSALSALAWGSQILPALWLAWALVRSLDQADEWQRVVVFESLTYGFVAAMLALFAGGQLEAAGLGTDHAPLRVAHSVALDAGILVPLAVLFVKSHRAG
jgi:hypothetical protein